MNSFVESLLGMDTLTDEVIATDLLISSKTGVINYALALTESVTPEVKTVLWHQMEEAIAMHEHMSNYMMNRGWYHAYDMDEQIHHDMKRSDTALSIGTV